MKHTFIRQGLMILLIGLSALIAGQAQAQHSNYIHLESLSWGLSQGQSARVSVANFVFLDGSVRSIPVTVHIQLLDTEGEVIAQSGELRIEPGKTRFWDVPRQSLPAGEATGRLQVRARLLILRQERTQSPPAIPSIEVFDSGTGRTVAIFDAFLKIEGVPGESRD
jgi:prepilin-type processing-associated H-X9-DG protein